MIFFFRTLLLAISFICCYLHLLRSDLGHYESRNMQNWYFFMNGILNSNMLPMVPQHFISIMLIFCLFFQLLSRTIITLKYLPDWKTEKRILVSYFILKRSKKRNLEKNIILCKFIQISSAKTKEKSLGWWKYFYLLKKMHIAHLN